MFEKFKSNICNYAMVTAFFIIISTGFGNNVFANANSYQVPDTPELYEKSPEGPGQKAEYGSNLYFGLGLGLGQSQSNGEDANPIASYNGNLELGYQSLLRSTRLMESSLTVFNGRVGHSRAEVDIGVGFLARLGYGYKIGNNLWGIWKAGAGLASGSFSGKTPEGFVITNDGSITGTLAQGAFYLVNQTNGVSFFGGAKWSYYNFGLSTASYQNAEGTTQSLDKNIGLSVPEIEVGIRLSL